MSCYVIDAKKSNDSIRSYLPFHGKMSDATLISVELLDRADPSAMRVVSDMLNEEILAGTYPQNAPLNHEGFLAYYCSHDVFVGKRSSDGTILGAFYIKPNFPGRCAHICNGGFLVGKPYRGLGVGKVLAAAFEVLAPACGYEAAFFNLVFIDNPASVRLWNNFGYRQTGVVPEAKVNSDGSKVDALMFYKRFAANSEKN